MRLLVLLTFLFVSTTVSAWNVKPNVEIGRVYWKHGKDGLWYQEGMSHKIRDKSQMIQMGAVFEFEKLDLKTGVFFYEPYEIDALARPDGEYSPWHDKSCIKIDGCKVVGRFHGEGDIKGLSFILSSKLPKDSIDIYGMGGLLIYVPSWKVNVIHEIDAPDIRVEYADDWKLGATVGIGIGIEKFQFQYSFQYLPVTSKFEPPMKASNNLSLVIRF